MNGGFIEASNAPDTLSVEELESTLTSWAGSMAASEYRWLRLVGEYDRRRLWERWECRSCAHWLMWHCALDIRAAYERVRVARALESLPVISSEFAAGRVSYSKVRAITRVATPHDEEAWVNIARSTHTSGVERIVAGTRRAAALNAGEAERRRWQRSVNYRSDGDGMITTIIRLPVEEHALLEKAITTAMEASGERSAEQRRADAVVTIAAQYLAGGSGEARTADRYQTVVRVDAEALTGGAGEATVDGNAVPVETVRRLCCDGSVIALVEDEDGNPVGVSPKTRTVPAATRRALQARDQHCRFPGCANHGWLDAHHRIHWIDNGPTNLHNLLLLCRQHHKAVHEGGWTIHHTDNGELRFTNPDGWSPTTPPATITEIPLDIPPGAITPDWYGDPIDLRYITAVMLN